MTVDCPACGGVNDERAAECSRCHLSAGLFSSVREAVGDAGSDPHYLRIANDALRALEDAGAAGPGVDDAGAGPGALSHAGRFPAVAAPRTSREAPEPVHGLEALPALPALPPGAGFELHRHQVDDLLQLARRQGIDLAEFSDRAKRAILVQDIASLEVLGRELFVYLAASLGEEFDAVCAVRNDLAALVPTSTPDAELDACRQALLMGDLAGAQRRLHRVTEALADLEAHWETVQILLTECDLLAETVRELGGDPAPALGPLEEGRRLAAEGQRELAEPILARATHALWSVLTPHFRREMEHAREALLRARDAGVEVTGAVATMRVLATDLRHRNFAAGILAFRRLRVAVEALPPPAAGADPGAAPETPLATPPS